ncbi:MAG: hypothetical protein P0Y58_12240 [Candidatus Pseudomonas phytovorans]|uniref:Uncharacterized protein n=1 Tax=Candidatus Pseudomonas phytovorans TaxID=3121377 RepID=A0AAJ5WLL5_9PSED|nr:hypothetical protein [Pseudomonas sp.]WEK32920.1 MAG: hypothetical protein P0Y58_12240 [Pseudomonas sp.]
MDREPTNQEVADVVGIEVDQVKQYRDSALQLGDGSWLVHFSFDMPRELRHSFTGSFTAIVAEPLDAIDERSLD